MDRFIDKILEARYRVDELIGIGGMANVYKGYDITEDRIVAIKVLKEEFLSDSELVRRFKNEGKAIAVLAHTNIVKVFDVIFDAQYQAIVMEYALIIYGSSTTVMKQALALRRDGMNVGWCRKPALPLPPTDVNKLQESLESLDARHFDFVLDMCR